MKTGIVVTIVVLLSIVGLGFFQYQQLESGSATGGSLSALSTAFSASISGADADISQVNQLLSVLDQVSVLAQLDTGLFTSPKYSALKDFSVTLFPAQSIGRTNPFLGIDEGVVVPSPAVSTRAGVSNKTNSTGLGATGSAQQSSSGALSGGTTTGATPQPDSTTAQQVSSFVDQGQTQGQIPIPPPPPDVSALSSAGPTTTCDPFTNPSCLEDPAALEAYLNSFNSSPSN